MAMFRITDLLQRSNLMSEVSAQISALDAQITAKTQAVLEQIKNDELSHQISLQTSESGSNANTFSVSPELVQLFFVLRYEYEEVKSLLRNKEIDEASQKLDDLQAKRSELCEMHPNTLLGVDLMRKLESLRSEIDELSAQQWDETVHLTDSSFYFEKGPNNDVKLSEAGVKYGSSGLLSRLEKVLIDPLISLKIHLEIKDDKLVWSNQREIFEASSNSGLESLVSNVRTLAEFVAKSPEPLNTIIPRRFASHLILQLQRTSLPLLYPNTADPQEFAAELRKLLPSLEETWLKPEWTKGAELTRFAENFATIWPDVRQEHYLMRLRKIYQQPVTEESRVRIVTWYEEPVLEFEQEQAKDEWEWNEDDEDENEETDVLPSVNAAGASDIPNGTLIDLWTEYSMELTSHTLFYTLYRALIPVAYGDHDLWIYEDTSKFLSQIKGRAAGSPNNHSNVMADIEPLVRLCDDHLDRFIKHELNVFENTLLPALFSPKQSGEAVSKILSTVDSLAMDVNSVGGPELRQSVLSLIVERIAVYVISGIEQLSDIGDSESQELAILIAKLDPLAVYFDQVTEAVPSWTKLEVLRSILTSSLASLGEMLDQHRLLDFSPDELASLICALFQDSNDRSRLVTRFYNAVH